MKKLYVYVALAAMGVMAACSKNDNVDPQGNGGNTVIDDNSPVAVELGVSGVNLDVNVTPKSKAAGALDTWNSQALYIYAFDRTEDDFKTAAFIDNVQGTAPAASTPDPQPGDTLGVITLTNPAYPGEPFYYSGSTVYDFYGYYIDDAAVESAVSAGAVVPTETATSIYVPFRINGTQDLMVAKADPAVDVEGATETVESTRAYSAYAARRGVQPTLRFRHLLSRFNFEIKPGAASADNVTVDSIALVSKVEGELVVVSANAEDLGLNNIVEGTLDTLCLPGIAAEGVKTETFNSGLSKEEQTSKAVGTNLLVIPGETSYELLVWLSNDNGDSPIAPQVAQVTLLESATFDAGKVYTVTIMIYGLESVEVSASLTGWQDGGSVVIDPDQDMIPGQDDEEEVIEPEP